MPSVQKILDAVLSGRRDQNIRFSDLCKLLTALDFAERIKGDHHIYSHNNIEEIINLQPRADHKAKPYQVKQVRQIITHYKLGFDT